MQENTDFYEEKNYNFTKEKGIFYEGKPGVRNKYY